MCEQGICMGDAPLTKLISKIDVDGSGRIDFTEFVAAAIEQDKIIDNEKLRRAFDYFDKDLTGKITVQNLKEALKVCDNSKVRKIIE